MRLPLDRVDWALLAAYLLAASLGTWTRCLLVHDGAILLSAAWLGNAWDIYFSQNASRAVSTLISFGPIWAARWAFGLSSSTFIFLGHILYFLMPLGLWFALRVVEPMRLFSRLYLALALALVYFLAELVIGAGLWMMWMAIVTNPARSKWQIAVATLLLGAGMAFSHPTTGLMSFLFLLVGGALTITGRPFPRRALVATAVLTLLLIASYFAALRWLPATNPTIVTAVARIRYDYIDPRWMLKTVLRFPALAVLWFLLLAPSIDAIGSPRRISHSAITVVAVVGLGCAAAGTQLLTWMYARHTGGYVLVVATALAIVEPSTWLKNSHRPLTLYAAILSVAFISYNSDLYLFGRFIDRHLPTGLIDVDKGQAISWPVPYKGPISTQLYLKWAVGSDYVRDFVVPTFDWYQVTLAFYSYFRSHRQGVLFHELNRHGDWLPYECPAIDRAQRIPHDQQDRTFLDFLAENYCPR